MRYDWRNILSWTEVLCFVLVWCLGIGATVVQFYAQKSAPEGANVAAAESASTSGALD